MAEMISRTLRLLLVDDSPTYARSIQSALETCKDVRFVVERADSLHAAAAIIPTVAPDVILLDLILPDSIGLGTLRDMRARAPGIPIVALTALEDGELRNQVIRAGAQDYVVKSERDRTTLIRAVRYALAVIECARLRALMDRKEEEVLLLFDNIIEGFFTTDLHGNCAMCNPAAARILGYNSPDDLIGKNMHSITHQMRSNGLRYPEAECHINNVIRTGTAVHVDTEVFWRSDGRSVPVEYFTSPLRRGDRIVGAVTVFLDITKLRHVESTLYELRERFNRHARTLISIAGEWSLEQPKTRHEKESLIVVNREAVSRYDSTWDTA